ncbi:hypothetical protein [Kitasatospora sp. NPDC098663]|uniref:hypothetical protein n=1 Tax=Kitasatospora sp. NPDC098663 TaxID=3364096 RepID=UPI003826B160
MDTSTQHRPPRFAGTGTLQKNLPVARQRVLAWLQAQPGATWQERWTSTGAENLPKEGWLDLPRQWFTRAQGLVLRDSQLAPGLPMLICGNVIRPTSAWLLSRTSQHLGRAMAPARESES